MHQYRSEYAANEALHRRTGSAAWMVAAPERSRFNHRHSSALFWLVCVLACVAGFAGLAGEVLR